MAATQDNVDEDEDEALAMDLATMPLGVNMLALRSIAEAGGACELVGTMDDLRLEGG